MGTTGKGGKKKSSARDKKTKKSAAGRGKKDKKSKKSKKSSSSSGGGGVNVRDLPAFEAGKKLVQYVCSIWPSVVVADGGLLLSALCRTKCARCLAFHTVTHTHVAFSSPPPPTTHCRAVRDGDRRAVEKIVEEKLAPLDFCIAGEGSPLWIAADDDRVDIMEVGERWVGQSGVLKTCCLCLVRRARYISRHHPSPPFL